MADVGRRELASSVAEVGASKRREAAAAAALERLHHEAAGKLAAARQEAEVSTHLLPFSQCGGRLRILCLPSITPKFGTGKRHDSNQRFSG